MLEFWTWPPAIVISAAALLVALVSLFFIVHYGKPQLEIARKMERLSAFGASVTEDDLKVMKIVAGGRVQNMSVGRQSWNDRFPFFELTLRSLMERGFVSNDFTPMELTPFGHEVFRVHGDRIADFKL